MPWTCPKCERTFRNKNQWHSCGRFEVQDHLEGKPEVVRETFDRLVAALPVGASLDAVKGSINLVSGSHFGSVEVQRSALVLGLVMDRRIKDERFQPVGEIPPSTFLYRLRLTCPEDVDAEVAARLRQAYASKK